MLIGRPKAWEFDKQNSAEEKALYCMAQRATILKAVRLYNSEIPVVQNMNFGHTDPQVPMPYGNRVRIEVVDKKVFATF